MHLKKRLLCGLIVTLSSTSIYATEFIVKDVDKNRTKNSTWIALPYFFSSESTGLTAGVIGIFNGFIQPQMSMFVTAYAGDKIPVENINTTDDTQNEARSRGLAFGINGYKPSFFKRTFISLLGNFAYYPNQKVYLHGSNDSNKNEDSTELTNFTPFRTKGYNNWVRVDFRYVLPIGEGKQSTTPIVKLKQGIVVNRADKGNGTPFITGQTLVGTELFYTKFTADRLTNEPSLNANGLRVYLEHDNTDYPDNPSRGYNMKLKFSADFGLSNSNQSWNSIEASYSHYFELPNFTWSKQNVLAFNAWSAYSPSWDKSAKNEDGLLDKNQPPMWEGARLGGYHRMRAYDSNRFSDKAAIYTALEYRLIPEYNPLHGQKWNPIPIDWFQTVLFAEAGRVAPSYNLKTFTQDVKYDFGLSLRALTAKVPMRFEVAYGQEGVNMWVMIKQPF